MLDRTFLKSVPHSPGVYLMLDASSTVLYVGKAKDLTKRLASYVNHSGPNHSKTGVMLKQVAKADILITRTEKEALILEASLIKRHKPKYNVILRDDKSYPLIKVTVQEEWPRVFMTRRKKKDGARYFGPYSSSSAMWSTLKLLSGLFPLRRCKGAILRERKRPCLNYQMGRCLAPCAGKAGHDEYRAMVDKVLMFLEGRNLELLKDLDTSMQEASKNLEFEKAAGFRDQIKALKRTLEKQLVVSHSKKDIDVFGFARNNIAVSTAVLYIRGGSIRGSRYYSHDDPYGDDSAILSQVVKQIYGVKSQPPAELLLPHPIEDQELLGEYLSDLGGRKVRLTVPQRGDRVRLVEMANTNASQYFEEQHRKERSYQSLAEALVRKLKLESPPVTIECVDISNISGTHNVGSLVRFANGEPDKKWYRHYRIASIQGPDDYAMMKEVITRRFERGLEEDDLPDLFMVDGGRGQLGIAQAVARDLGLEHTIPLLAIAKERQDEGEKLYKPGRKNPISLLPHDPVLLYLMRIRDETHRFGITFHRKLRNKNSLASELDRIDGIGPKRRNTLLAGLGSIKNLSQATVEELQQIKGVGPDLAAKIKHHFSSGKEEK